MCPAERSAAQWRRAYRWPADRRVKHRLHRGNVAAGVTDILLSYSRAAVACSSGWDGVVEICADARCAPSRESLARAR
jgi:hypothetical protein